MKYDLTKPCNDCPFRTNSVKGWIGGYENAEQLIRVAHSEEPFHCHEHLLKSCPDGYSNPEWKAWIEESGQVCVGSILFAEKTCKSFRPGPLREMQDRLDGADLTRILGFREFLEHHKTPLKISAKAKEPSKGKTRERVTGKTRRS